MRSAVSVANRACVIISRSYVLFRAACVLIKTDSGSRRGATGASMTWRSAELSEATSDRDAIVVEQRLTELIARYGARWSDPDLEVIRSRIRRSVKLGAALRSVPMTNADEPGNVFKPYRGEK